MTTEIPGRYVVHGGVQIVEHFDNGYGVSIICHDGSYGGQQNLWEIAVLHCDSPLAQWERELLREEATPDMWHLCYATPITSDTLGWLDWAAVDRVIGEVKALPRNSGCRHKRTIEGWEEATVTMEADEWREVMTLLERVHVEDGSAGRSRLRGKLRDAAVLAG